MTILPNKRVILVKRGPGLPTEQHFALDVNSTVDTESLKDGEILVKTEYLSLDPYLINRMGRQGEHPDKVPKTGPWPLAQFNMFVVDIGDCFGGRGVGRVINSKHPSVAVGDLVAADWGWQEYAIVNVAEETTFEKLETDIFGSGVVTTSTALGILSVSGSHALWGYNFCAPKEGETLVISAAAGNIGIIVGQLGKLHNVRVVGIAGGPEKCAKLKEELGLDAVVDYKAGNNDEAKLTQLIRDVCPNGVDAYFDNVGGVISEAVANNLNREARVYMCGAISGYFDNADVKPSERCKAVYAEKNVKNITCMEANYIEAIPQARRTLFDWIKEGKLRPIEWVVEGIENTAAGWVKMYAGKNFGKSIVKVAQS